jgi:hypothetical protein
MKYKGGTMSSSKSGSATACENMAKSSRKSIKLEEEMEVLEEWRVGNHVLLFIGN